jgi:hypothetical protein
MGMEKKPRRGEAGSAYIIALLVLVVLTIIGLGLTLVTQSEVQIGANERTANRSFYASDSGHSLAIMGTLRRHWDKNMTVHLNTTKQDTGSSASTTFSDEITITPLIQISSQFSAVTDITSGYSRVTHVVNSTSTRTGLAGSGGSTVPFSQKTVGTTVSLDPWQTSTFQQQSNDITQILSLGNVNF